jgi:hypothetical protein
MMAVEQPAAARVTAAGLLLDRGWGKATQVVSTEDNQPLRVIIRHIVGNAGDSAKVIDQDITPSSQLIETVSDTEEK